MIVAYLKQITNALSYSFDGFKVALKEKAFQMELLASIILIPTALAFDRSAAEKSLLILSLFIILIAELLNTAIEKTVNRISQEKHPLSKQGKDLSSCAVLFSVINFVIVWSMILLKS